ncbi:MAG TPA: NUDIX domain-containing protein [Polyangiaceae bacterium LLY-WYZ-15_(1-7)]|nr:NUDIX hydrolase [Sandaracinus sp.]HJK89561.1 NUDIX domain-containing protein [Polyangiaceae bacterium LLY-WYZ-15_(1-7)]MBJ73307.1 NUDIX hydrolase [Sandaracinus sp.]HJL03873.1 NUDIX domain-containing protein [Polyangiaceae bacterium LLY-WYZ-15_(1-7)]HJL07609.1 NUDIX domain-containing protein [Polyangiaceae bacterium LLY-WYZ-15_(1-7)]
MSATYAYPRPALTVDCVVFGLDDEGLKVLCIERELPPFEGAWALPGGFVRVGEALEEAARRELQEETGLEKVYLEQLYTFGAPDRDPREHTVSVAWYALTNIRDHRVVAATDARDAQWFPLHALPELAFDHGHIVGVAHERLQGKVRYRPVGFELLPRRFTLTQLQHLYEVILERELDKRNFRKKVSSLDLLVDTGEREKNVPRRPARLYRFDKRKYRALEKQGFEFSI